MRRCLIDTDIVSEIVRGKSVGVGERSRAYEAEYGVFTVSAVTVMELAKGLWKRGRADLLADLLAAEGGVEVLVLDGPTAQLAGRIGAELESQGLPIGRADPMIAATAIRHDLVLVSGNTAHFNRIVLLGHPLSVENWRQESER